MLAAITAAADFTLDGRAQARFTLPKSEIDGRGFALQPFELTTVRRQNHYRALWNFNKSALHDTTLTFSFLPPKYTVSKHTTYVVVLYSDQLIDVSPSPSPSAAGSPSADPASSSEP